MTLPVAEFLSSDAPPEVEPRRGFLVDVGADAALFIGFAAGGDEPFVDPEGFLASLDLEALLTSGG